MFLRKNEQVQAIPVLKEKIEKITKEKMDCMRLIIRMQEEFDEKEDNCRHLKTMISELEESNVSMKESYEYTISVSLNVTSYTYRTATNYNATTRNIYYRIFAKRIVNLRMKMWSYNRCRLCILCFKKE